MRAPRALAASSSSTTSTHAPSPMTKPARVASKGRDARGGCSSSATSPRLAQNPARISGGMPASVPPAGTALPQPLALLHNPDEAADRRAEHNPDPRRIEAVEARVLHRLLRRREREQDVAVELPHLL